MIRPLIPGAMVRVRLGWGGHPACYLCFFCKQKTAYEMRISDWSSDVCSSDLGERCVQRLRVHAAQRGAQAACEHLACEARGVGAEQWRHQVPAHARALGLAPCADVLEQRVAESGGAQARPAFAGLRSDERRAGKGWVRTCGVLGARAT